MAEHRLVIYSLRVRRRDNRAEVLPANVIDAESGLQLVAVLEDELLNLHYSPLDLGSRKLKIWTEPNPPKDPLLNRNGRSTYGQCRYGYHGDVSEVEDKNDKVVFNKDGTHTEYVPMFFSFYVNSPNERGYLILQTTGKSGIKTVIEVFLRNRVFSKFKDYVFSVKPYWPPQLLEQYRKGKATYVELQSRKVASDVTDVKFLKEADGMYEVTTRIRPVKNRGRAKREVEAIGQIQKTGEENLKISDLTNDEDVYAAKIGVKVGDIERSLYVGGIGGHPPANDINLKAVNDFTPKGHPKLSAMKREADKVVEIWDL